MYSNGMMGWPGMTGGFNQAGMVFPNPMMSSCSMGGFGAIPSMSGGGCGGMPSGCSTYSGMLGCNGMIPGINGMVPYYNGMQSCSLCGASGNLPPWISYNGGNFQNNIGGLPNFNAQMMINPSMNISGMNGMMGINGMGGLNSMTGMTNPMGMNPYVNPMMNQQAYSNYATQLALSSQGLQASYTDVTMRNQEIQSMLLRMQQAQNGLYNQTFGVNSGTYNLFGGNNSYYGNGIQGATSPYVPSFNNGFVNQFQVPPNANGIYAPTQSSGTFFNNSMVPGAMGSQYPTSIVNRTF